MAAAICDAGRYNVILGARSVIVASVCCESIGGYIAGHLVTSDGTAVKSHVCRERHGLQRGVTRGLGRSKQIFPGVSARVIEDLV